MRIRRITVRSFGPLHELDTGSDPLPGLVVVQAPNEGGKSSFFVALSTLLYGFYPASRDRHPYAPWSGADADVEARIGIRDGSELEVHRRLLASPWGRVTRSEKTRDVANRTLSCAAHVRRELFHQVFALTLGDLARVDAESWQEIQDRLLGAMGAEDVRATRVVAKELDEEADSLWRGDRRGKPKARKLQRRLEELNRRRREAKAEDQSARETARNVEELGARLEAVREERRRERAMIARARTLAPVRAELMRIREAETRAGDPGELVGLPPDPRQCLAELDTERTEAARRIGELKVRVGKLRQQAEAVTDADRALLERSARVRELGKIAGEVTSGRQRLRSLEEEESVLDRRLRELARNVLSGPWDDEIAPDVRKIPLGELRARVRRYRRFAERASSCEAELAALERTSPPGADRGSSARAVIFRGAVIAAAGAALALWGFLAGRPFVAGAGGVLVLAGFTWAAVRISEFRVLRSGREAHDQALGSLREERDEARRGLDEARRAVRDVVSALPVSEGLLSDPDPEVTHLLEAIQGTLADRDRVRNERERLSERMKEARSRLDETADAVGIVLPDEFLSAVVVLEERLEEAMERERGADAAGESLSAALEELEGLREKDRERACRIERLRERLCELGGGEVERGIERAVERMRAGERARTFREELERRHPDLEELRRRIAEAEAEGEEWTADEEALLRAEDRAEELHREEKELIAEIEARKGALRELEGGTTLDRVEGEVLQVREELDAVRRRRDRLALLSRVVRAADHRFRERNQPDLLRTAGRYLETITGGRYRRMLMSESDLEGTLYLDGPGYPHPVEVDTPVSTGTREQVYLALRLAIVDHLDAGGERLPLFLDEAFVNWDAERRERGFALLAELAAGDRQLFVFTCHEEMAASLEGRGGRLIRLDGPA